MHFEETFPSQQPAWLWPDFSGSKLALFLDAGILTYRRDERPDLPYAGYWDLPGGGRENSETPVECALRELHEEFGLRLPAGRLRGHVFPSTDAPGLQAWLFAGRITRDEIASIRFGDEGQEWRLMPLDDFLRNPRSIPHFKARIRVALDYPLPPYEPEDASSRP